MSWRRRNGGVSRVGSSMRANSGSHFATGSSSDSLPSSRSFRIASAVKLLVIDAIRNTVAAVIREPFDVRSRTPKCRRAPAAHRSLRPTPSPESSFPSAYLRRFDRPPASPLPAFHPIRIGEARRRVSVARYQSPRRRQAADQRDNSHVGQHATDHCPPALLAHGYTTSSYCGFGRGLDRQVFIRYSSADRRAHRDRLRASFNCFFKFGVSRRVEEPPKEG